MIRTSKCCGSCNCSGVVPNEHNIGRRLQATRHGGPSAVDREQAKGYLEVTGEQRVTRIHSREFAAKSHFPRKRKNSSMIRITTTIDSSRNPRA